MTARRMIVCASGDLKAEWPLLFGYIVRRSRGKEPLHRFCKRLKVSPATVSRIERCGIPDLNTFRALCVGLDIDPRVALGMKRSQP